MEAGEPRRHPTGPGRGPIGAPPAVAYPDTITVGARVSSIEADRFAHSYRVVSHAQDEVVAEGEGSIVSYDYGARRKAPVPDAVRAAIEALEEGE